MKSMLSAIIRRWHRGYRDATVPPPFQDERSTFVSKFDVISFRILQIPRVRNQIHVGISRCSNNFGTDTLMIRVIFYY